MIVIATNNGTVHLPRLLESIEKFGVGKHSVLIVDTGSTSTEFLGYLASLDRAKYTVTRTPYKGYDTGAYLWAYHNFKADSYMFMHDSMEVLVPEWLQCFEDTGADICSYCGFQYNPYVPGSEEQLSYFTARSMACETTRRGIFGPIFYAKRSALDIMDKKLMLARAIPYHKMAQTWLEGGWAMMADLCGLNVAHLGDLSSWRPGDVIHTFYYTMRKYSPVRA